MVRATSVNVQGLPRFNVSLQRFATKRIKPLNVAGGIAVAGGLAVAGGFGWAHLSYEVMPLFEMGLAWGGTALTFLTGKAIMSQRRLGALPATFSEAIKSGEQNFSETEQIFNGMSARARRAVSAKLIGRPTTQFNALEAGLRTHYKIDQADAAVVEDVASPSGRRMNIPVVKSEAGVINNFITLMKRFDTKRVKAGNSTLLTGAGALMSVGAGFAYANLTYAILPLVPIAIGAVGLATLFIGAKALRSRGRLSAIREQFKKLLPADMAQAKAAFDKLSPSAQKAIRRALSGLPHFNEFLRGGQSAAEQSEPAVGDLNAAPEADRREPAFTQHPVRTDMQVIRPDGMPDEVAEMANQAAAVNAEVGTSAADLDLSFDPEAAAEAAAAGAGLVNDAQEIEDGQIQEIVGTEVSIMGGNVGYLETDFAVGLSVLGPRENNEDGILIFESEQGRVHLLLADGMGGHDGGDIASTMTLEAVQASLIENGMHSIQSRPILEMAISGAHSAVQERFADRSGTRKPGTTLEAVVIDGDQMALAHVGDSRVYKVGNDGAVSLLTKDDSFNADLMANPDMDLLEEGPEREMFTFPIIGVDAISRYEDKLFRLQQFGRKNRDGIGQWMAGNVIAKAVGLMELNLQTTRHQLQPGEWVLLCSDGVTDVLKGAIAEILERCKREGKSILETRRIIEQEVGKSFKDNTSIILYEHQAVISAQADEEVVGDEADHEPPPIPADALEEDDGPASAETKRKGPPPLPVFAAFKRDEDVAVQVDVDADLGDDVVGAAIVGADPADLDLSFEDEVTDPAIHDTVPGMRAIRPDDLETDLAEGAEILGEIDPDEEVTDPDIRIDVAPFADEADDVAPEDLLEITDPAPVVDEVLELKTKGSGDISAQDPEAIQHIDRRLSEMATLEGQITQAIGVNQTSIRIANEAIDHLAEENQGLERQASEASAKLESDLSDLRSSHQGEQTAVDGWIRDQKEERFGERKRELSILRRKFEEGLDEAGSPVSLDERERAGEAFYQGEAQLRAEEKPFNEEVLAKLRELRQKHERERQELNDSYQGAEGKITKLQARIEGNERGIERHRTEIGRVTDEMQARKLSLRAIEEERQKLGTLAASAIEFQAAEFHRMQQEGLEILRLQHDKARRANPGIEEFDSLVEATSAGHGKRVVQRRIVDLGPGEKLELPLDSQVTAIAVLSRLLGRRASEGGRLAGPGWLFDIHGEPLELVQQVVDQNTLLLTRIANNSEGSYTTKLQALARSILTVRRSIPEGQVEIPNTLRMQAEHSIKMIFGVDDIAEVLGPRVPKY